MSCACTCLLRGAFQVVRLPNAFCADRPAVPVWHLGHFKFSDFSLVHSAAQVVLKNQVRCHGSDDDGGTIVTAMTTMMMMIMMMMMNATGECPGLAL